MTAKKVIDATGDPWQAGSMTTPETAAASADFGEPSARKTGRDARWPYVPVIVHATDVPGRTRQEQIVPRAYATRDEAVSYAATVIAVRRGHLAERLAMPNNRALRAQYGVAS